MPSDVGMTPPAAMPASTRSPNRISIDGAIAQSAMAIVSVARQIGKIRSLPSASAIGPRIGCMKA